MAKRQKKTTRQQYHHLLNFVEENKILLSGKTKPFEALKVNLLWEKFAKKLTNSSFGPIKTASQWKKVFIEWKVNTKRKNRYILAHQEMDEGSGTSKTLNDLEKRLLNLISNHLEDSQLLDTPKEEPILEEEVITVQVVDDSKENQIILNVNSIEHDYVNRKPTADTSNSSINTQEDEYETPQKRVLSMEEVLKREKELSVQSSKTNSKTLDPQANATLALADAINNFTNAFKLQAEASLLMAKIKKEEVKLHYYKTFGNLDRFEL